jgi:hypothetical protein
MNEPNGYTELGLQPVYDDEDSETGEWQAWIWAGDTKITGASPSDALRNLADEIEEISEDHND